MRQFCRTSIFFIILVIASNANAQVQVSGLADVVLRNAEEGDITNVTFLGFSNFHTIRTRLFFDGQIDHNVYAFAQVLMNSYGGFQLFAAYARFDQLSGPYLNLQIGLIPTTVGTFSARAYSDKNPLIGVPLLYNHHTAIAPGNIGSMGSFAELETVKQTRSRGGLPIIYDACWNSGIEIYGTSGKLDYSMGILTGSLTKPTAIQAKNLPQVTTRLAYNFEPGLRIALSGYYGPYLFEDAFDEGATLENPDFETKDFMNTGIGYDFYYAQRYLEIYSEGYITSWEYPGIPDLEMLSGYFEMKYKMNPRWFLAGRFGLMEPNEIDDGAGGVAKWDYPIKRYELGLGYKATRKTTVKFVAQLNRFDINDSYDSDLYAVQVSLPFN